MKKLLLIFVFLLTFDNAYALNIKAKAYVLKDLNTGKVLASKNADVYLPPASTTKLMTLYLLFEKVNNGELKLTDRLPVSKRAWKRGGSKMFLDPGSKIRVVDLIKGISVSSGNDASTVVAEYIGGSEKEFVKLMNRKAREFEMTRTNFVNPTGWDNKGHVSSANDLAILGERIIKDFPEYYKVFGLKSFKHNGIRQYNKNTLLGKLGVDGLKTGHVKSIGYNIVSSAKQNQLRYLVVLLGAKNKHRRETEVKKLYQYAYNKYKNVKILSAAETIAQTQVYLGSSRFIELGIEHDLYMNLTQKEYDTLSSSIEYFPIVNAPVHAGQVLGKIKIKYEGLTIPKYINLVAKTTSPVLPITQKIQEMIKYKFNKHTYFSNLQ
ncbi:MAG TPA: hypothetical protein DCL21_07540 [Alphaproteobacteria bacterium]|nr:hypothetical protein [Alphaproteobacteria bacterium]